ncbi:MAG: hypothetical protein CSB34_03810 [Desulfobulbus propionicus]|nr:MAG: hypothetical protein CSB34_03810 [Desulfobulbus propionicus]
MIARNFLKIFSLSIVLLLHLSVFSLAAPPEIALTSKHGLQLSLEEKEYLVQKGVIKMCIDPDWMPYEKNENGKHVGMSADYFKLLQKSIGTPVEIVPTSTWTESLEYGKARKCDIFSFIMSTPERLKYLDFTENYFETPLVIATEFHQPRISNIAELPDKPIGIVKGYAYGEIIRAKYPDIDLVDVDNVNDGLEKVEQGRLYGFIDTLASVGYYIQRNHIGLVKISGKFQETWQLGIGTRRDEPLLQSIFNKAIATILPEDYQKILNKWVAVAGVESNPNRLSLEEAEFLKAHPVIRFRTHYNQPPFEFDQDGEAAGIAVDYIKKIAEIVGFSPQFVMDDRKAFDTFLLSVKSPERAARFSFGDTCLSFPMVLITNKKSRYIDRLTDLTGGTVVVEKGFVTHQWLKRDYPGIKVVNAKSTKAALEMVNRGEVEAYMGNLAIANYMMTYGELENIRVAGPTEYGNVEYRFIAPKGWEALTSILGKGYRAIPPEEHSAIQQKWFSLQIIKKTDYGPIWKTIFAAALIIAWILWWNYKLKAAKRLLKENNNDLEELSVTDRLTGLYNRVKLEEVLDTSVARFNRYNEEFGIILVDIDHFKAVNDTFGHQTGDQILVEFATLLQNNSRTVDTVGRWGGEEFIIVCPHTDKKGVVTLAEHLRKVVEEFTFSEVGHKTASFGTAAYQKKETQELLLKRTDDALYQAKENGRNLVVFARASASSGARNLLQLVWKSEYESGHAEIDAQHRELVTQASVLMELIVTNSEQEKIKEGIGAISVALAKHFQYEESVLAGTSYPDLESHSKEHQMLLEKLDVLAGDYYNGKVEPFMFMQFVAQELALGHMLQTDVQYYEYLS